MLLQAKALAKFWKLNKIDGIIWIVTVFSVVLIDLDIGLLIGLLMSLASVLLQSVKSYTCVLGNVPNTDLYLDQNRYQGVSFLFLNLKISLSMKTKNLNLNA